MGCAMTKTPGQEATAKHSHEVSAATVARLEAALLSRNDPRSVGKHQPSHRAELKLQRLPSLAIDGGPVRESDRRLPRARRHTPHAALEDLFGTEDCTLSRQRTLEILYPPLVTPLPRQLTCQHDTSQRHLTLGLLATSHQLQGAREHMEDVVDLHLRSLSTDVVKVVTEDKPAPALPTPEPDSSKVADVELLVCADGVAVDGDWAPISSTSHQSACATGFAYFGVYDGHQGCQVADFLSSHLPGTVARHLEASVSLAAASTGQAPPVDIALKEAFKEVDETICRDETLGNAGACAAIALLLPASVYGKAGASNSPPVSELALGSPQPGRHSAAHVPRHTSGQLVVAWVGDTAAILCRRGVAMELSSPHRPTDPTERARIEAAGGSVSSTARLCGMLNTSRAFGDVSFKPEYTMSSNHIHRAGLMTAEPDVVEVAVTEADEFLILCSDGLLEGMKPQQVVNTVKAELLEHSDVDRAAAVLVEQAIGKHKSKDNASVVLCAFHQGLPADEANSPTLSPSPMELELISPVTPALPSATGASATSIRASTASFSERVHAASTIVTTEAADISNEVHTAPVIVQAFE